jgi:hypothetical protein
MGIRFQNKGISESLAQATISCVMNGSCIANVPVGIYPNASGVLTAIGAAVASNAVNWGISTAAAATGAVTDICIGGKIKIAGGGGTDGQIVASIAAAGTATTAAAASATVPVGLGTCSGTNYVILY